MSECHECAKDATKHDSFIRGHKQALEKTIAAIDALIPMNEGEPLLILKEAIRMHLERVPKSSAEP